MFPASLIVLGIDDLNRANFDGSTSLEDRTVFGHRRCLIQSLSANQKISADQFLAFSKRTVGDHFVRGSQNFPAAFKGISCDVFAVIAQFLNPSHPFLHLRLHSLSRRRCFSATEQKHEIAHRCPFLLTRSLGFQSKDVPAAPMETLSQRPLAKNLPGRSGWA